MGRKRKRPDSISDAIEFFEAQQEEIDTEVENEVKTEVETVAETEVEVEAKEPEIESIEKSLPDKADKIYTEKAEVIEHFEEESKPKVEEARSGKIVRIFSNNMAMVEIGNIKSLITIRNAKRYSVGDIIKL